MSIVIREGALEEVIAVNSRIPEFAGEAPQTLEDFKNKIGSEKSHILIASLDGADVGYTASFDRDHDGSWYMWMAGVAPEGRGQKCIIVLLEQEEGWARAQGYSEVRVKTRNIRIGMRISLARAGYNMTAVEVHENPLDTRLLHSKKL